jgi:hypothetical protein
MPAPPTLLLLALAASAAAAQQHLRVPRSALHAPGAHPATRAAHRAAMATWRAPAPAAPGSPVVFPTAFGADPTGATDSSAAFAQAVAALLTHARGNLSDGIRDLGGAVLDLQGGTYLLSQPLAIPQYVGNLRVIDGTLRAAAAFPPAEFVLQVGGGKCSPPSGQGSCNENVGLSGLTLDGAHVAAGCLRISSTMGATLDASSAVFGFNQTGILIAGGHEVMVTETWVAAYFWSEPEKEKTDTVGILVAGNDHFLTNVIVFSARVGVRITGAANKAVNCHTWNQATGNGGIGILNEESQNIFYGCALWWLPVGGGVAGSFFHPCARARARALTATDKPPPHTHTHYPPGYLDFTDFVMANAQQISFTGGFFLGGAQAVFAAQRPNDAVLGVTFSGNVWYDCSGPSLAVNESAGFWGSVTDLEVSGTAFCGYSRTAATGLVTATRVLTNATGPLQQGAVTVDFSSALLFPRAGIASVALAGNPFGGGVASGGGCAGYVSAPLPVPGEPLQVQVTCPAQGGGSCSALAVTVTQSNSSTWSVQAVA